MDKAVHQIKAGKASEKKAALLPNGQQHPSVPPRGHPSVLCLSSLRTHSVTGIESFLFFFRLATPVSSSGNTRCSFCIFTATGQRI